ncbi:MAG: porphobilinogen synthase [Deltaproteobacteria bacterium]|nr:porphobilinogen synthase [Deltaproteobacteria bacterium]
MAYPTERPRRLRQSLGIRRMVAETTLRPEHLIQPLFVVPGRQIQQPIPTLSGISQWSVDRLTDEAKRIADTGVAAVLLFGIPAHKDAIGSEASMAQGIVQQACRALREAVPTLTIITDVCLCAYTDHGHCGVMTHGTQQIDNAASIARLAEVAVSHAAAGAHIVAPSDMMDGRVGAIRQGLDAAGLNDAAILSYAVKYASAFYGPFRAAQDSTPQWGDRKTYQMDPANMREALREVRLDIAEGADLVMVKPALPYLDIIHAVRAQVDVPIAAYQVSGEYAMIKAAAQQQLIDGDAVMRESLLAIRRAGADVIITYAAADVAKILA